MFKWLGRKLLRLPPHTDLWLVSYVTNEGMALPAHRGLRVALPFVGNQGEAHWHAKLMNQGSVHGQIMERISREDDLLCWLVLTQEGEIETIPEVRQEPERVNYARILLSL